MHTSHPRARGWWTTLVCWRPSPSVLLSGRNCYAAGALALARPEHPSYPAMLYLGLVCGVAASNVAAHAAQLAAGRVFVATLILLIPALLGARLLFVLTHWELYRADPGRIWRRAKAAAHCMAACPVRCLPRYHFSGRSSCHSGTSGTWRLLRLSSA